MSGKSGDTKGGRVNYSSSDKDIFKDIIKNTDGGKVGLDIFKRKINIFFQLFRVVMSGTTTNEMKHRFVHKCLQDTLRCSYSVVQGLAESLPAV